MELLPKYHTFPNFCGKIEIPFPEVSLENMTLKHGTPPCTPHMEVSRSPSPPPPPTHTHTSWKEPLSKQRVIPQNRAGIPQNKVFPQNRGIP